MLHTHAFTLSQNEEDLFGINFGNPRTRDGLIEWLGDGNALQVNINLLERKPGKMRHTIRFELRLEGGILGPTIMD
ncbi:unnamed protein product, partial [Mesorhabditis belari]|uniref:Uncharacterized protein n=1 Tax=Mesorhabditis belari TaxID=2138241 RepID=A0AAF3EK04_9BILA